jgi:hypothetical protein
MPTSRMTKKFGVLKFRGHIPFHIPLSLVFESDDPVTVMAEMERLNDASPDKTGYMVVCRKAERVMNPDSDGAGS